MKNALISISTSSSACSVTLVVQNQYYTKHEITANQHTQLILPMIDSLLKEAKIEKNQLTTIAVDEGPGSFTGLRIGLGVAQGLSFGLDLPIYTVSSLEALAFQAVQTNLEANATICCAIDARMGEVYWAVYNFLNGRLTTLQGPALGKLHEARQAQADYQALGIGTGFQTSHYPHSRHIAELALLQIEQGSKILRSTEIKPLYLRDKVAEKQSAN